MAHPKEPWDLEDSPYIVRKKKDEEPSLAAKAFSYTFAVLVCAALGAVIGASWNAILSVSSDYSSVRREARDRLGEETPESIMFRAVIGTGVGSLAGVAFVRATAKRKRRRRRR